jgi:hypothetical protein
MREAEAYSKANGKEDEFASIAQAYAAIKADILACASAKKWIDEIRPLTGRDMAQQSLRLSRQKD